jgi:hypothetical protein
MVMFKGLMLLLLTLPATAWAQPPARPAIAFVVFGGSAPPDKAPGSNRVESFVNWAVDAAPRFNRNGIKRVHLQNPGGLFPLVQLGGDTRGMRVDQWILAERARAPYANRKEFCEAVDVLRRHGITEIIVYVGSPTQLLDPVKELPQVLEAFTACGPIISFGFDAMFEDGAGEKWQDLWAEGSPYRAAIANLRKQHKVYAEARIRPAQRMAGLGQLVDGTIALARFDKRHPDLTGQPGESIRVTDTRKGAGWPEINQWPGNVTPSLRSEVNWGPLMDKASATPSVR